MGRRAYPRGFLLVPMRAWTRVSNMRWRSVLLKHLHGFVSHRDDATSGPSGDACDRPGRDVQYLREQSFASLNGRKRVKDLEALAYERHRTVSHPTNSAALICEEAPVLRPPMR
jgi:hypothetical protein